MSKFQQFDQPKLIDYYPSYEDFLNDYNNLGTPKAFNSDETIKTCYWVLMTRYGNSTVRGYTFETFRPILFTRIWQYGGTWEKRLEIQKKLRELSLDADSEIYRGSRTIYNSAFNDSSAPSTATLEEVPYINQQNTTNYKRSTLEGLDMLNNMLETDVTEEFLGKFANLFKVIVYSGETLLYPTYEEEN